MGQIKQVKAPMPKTLPLLIRETGDRISITEECVALFMQEARIYIYTMIYEAKCVFAGGKAIVFLWSQSCNRNETNF
jgi:hypothetical protein